MYSGHKGNIENWLFQIDWKNVRSKFIYTAATVLKTPKTLHQAYKYLFMKISDSQKCIVELFSTLSKRLAGIYTAGRWSKQQVMKFGFMYSDFHWS